MYFQLNLFTVEIIYGLSLLLRKIVYNKKLRKLGIF